MKFDKRKFLLEALLTPKSFLFEMPLYEEIDLTVEDDNEEKIMALSQLIHNHLSYNGTIDIYCTGCEKESIFDADRVETDSFDSWYRFGSGLSIHSYICTRNANHKYHSYFFKTGNSIRKVGQFPSLATFQIPQIEQYRKILGDNRYKEFTRGVGLAANGVGVGSYVYLRRIFESLIKDAYISAMTVDAVSKDEYESTSRIDEKILLLKKLLPKFLVENRAIYKVLSKGIHELEEDECLGYFATLKLGIERILKEKQRQLDDEKDEKIAKEEIANITQQLSTKE